MNEKFGPTLGGWLVYVMRKADEALALEEALHAILDSMKEYFPCQSVAVILVDEDTNEVRIKISRQISYSYAKKFRRAEPGPAVRQLLLEQKPLMITDADVQSPLYAELKLEHDFGAAVVAPLLRNHRGVGYVFCDRAPGETFSESDLLHLQVVGLLIGNLMEKYELLRQAKTLSQYDDASGALKYASFVPAFGTELQRGSAHGYPVTLAIVDVPAFRNFLETHGIDGAHRLLAEVGAVIKARTRDMDLLARYGADQFAVCFSGMAETEAAKLLGEAREEVRSKVGSGTQIAVDIFVGGVSMSQGRDLKRPCQEILAAAGKNLMDAKSQRAAAVHITPMAGPAA